MAKVIRTCVMGAMLAVASTGAFALTADLGTLSSTAATFGNTFYNSTSKFTDYYTFNIAGNGAVSGTTSDGSLMAATLTLSKDVVLTALMLTNTGLNTVYGLDLSIPTNGSLNTFSFAGLSMGSYSLAVQGYVKAGFGTASYSGTISTNAVPALSNPSASVASPAPEPADLALTLMGLAGVGLLLRRGRKAA